MIELLAGTAGILAVLFIGAVVYALTYRDERDLALLNLTIAGGDIKSLTKRATDLRAEVITQQKTIDNLRTGHDRLVDERDQAVRELGRLKAEAVAAKPKRGPNGRFVKKVPNLKIHVATDAAKPIACG